MFYTQFRFAFREGDGKFNFLLKEFKEHRLVRYGGSEFHNFGPIEAKLFAF